MGLMRIDERPKMSASEWEMREMRKHSIKRWIITIIEIAGIAGVIYAIWFVSQEVHP